MYKTCFVQQYTKLFVVRHITGAMLVKQRCNYKVIVAASIIVPVRFYFFFTTVCSYYSGCSRVAVLIITRYLLSGMLAPRLLPRAQMTRLSRILGIWFTYYVPVLINFMTPSKHLSIAYQGINLRRLLRFFFFSKAPHVGFFDVAAKARGLPHSLTDFPAHISSRRSTLGLGLGWGLVSTLFLNLTLKQHSFKKR